MMKKLSEIKISECMTPHPFSVGRQQTLTEARHRMREHRVRHLPVLDGGILVGVLSQRDINLVESFEGINPDAVSVDEAMSRDPYVVRPQISLAEVAEHMAEHKLGTAIIFDKGKVEGIFTTVDALRKLAEYAGS